jgi:hypothetical protein
MQHQVAADLLRTTAERGPNDISATTTTLTAEV